MAVDDLALNSVLGYFTLAASSVSRDDFPKKYVRGLPHYNIPLIHLARLAVDKRFSGKGLGHALISQAFKITLSVSNEVGCRYLITEAYPAKIGWYLRYGFIPIEGAKPGETHKLFLDIRTIRAASERG